MLFFGFACVPIGMKGDKADTELLSLAGASMIMPGTYDVPRDGDGKALIPDDKTYLRIKLQDDPIPPPENKGLVHFVLDYEDISHNIFVSGNSHKEEAEPFDYFTLTVENIEVKPAGKEKLILPAPSSVIKIFEKDKKYAAIFNNLRLEAGDYEYLRVNLYELNGKGKKTENTFHQIKYRDVLYPLNFVKKRIQFMHHFKVEKGKLSTLHSRPTQTKVVHYQQNNAEYRSQVEFEARGYNVHFPIDKIWINMKSISVTKNTGEVYVLNQNPFTFDLLSLRDSAVLLVGNDLLPKGEYLYFKIQLNDGNSIELEYESKPLTITNEYTRSFQIPGPFNLRGGRVTEIILDFDPNLSVYNTLDSGYVMEPTLKVVSILSMTAEQDLRVQNALGEYANTVIKEAEIIFEGRVNSIGCELSNNVRGNQVIYSILSIKVEDTLRGDSSNIEYFPLKMIGGKCQGKVLHVTSMPEFKLNETSIYFLKKYGERYSTVYGDMGKINL
ncbi:MAG: DUF4382 domain-containing protein [Leptospiraceae bacterium]|nr:DUF4382 domain-containing protein [Leptospiraceae bacterium]